MKLVTTIILFLFCILVSAQTVIVGTVKDSETKSPIPYVNIGIVKKEKGTVSTNDGEFEFEIPSNSMYDTPAGASIIKKPDER